MEGIYRVYYGTQSIGEAKVSREGLYYNFHCECKNGPKEIYKIFVRSGDQMLLLGTPVPKGGAFLLDTKIPRKRLESGALKFIAVTKSEGSFGKFVVIKENEPFLYLKDLKDAFWQAREGVKGIVIAHQKCKEDGE